MPPEDNQFLSRVLRGEGGFTGSTDPAIAPAPSGGTLGRGTPGAAPGAVAAPAAAPAASPGTFGNAPGSGVGGQFGPGSSLDPNAFSAEASFGPSGGAQPSSLGRGIMDTLSGLAMIAGGVPAVAGFGLNAIGRPNQPGFPGMFNTAINAMGGGMAGPGAGFAAPGVTGPEPDLGGGFGPAGGGFGGGPGGEFGGTEGFSDFGGMDFSDIDAAEGGI